MRLVDTKYYASVEDMQKEIREMVVELKCAFIVGGRFDGDKIVTG